jgi:hypothetical protein
MVIEIHHAVANKAQLNKHRSRCAGAAGQQDREPIHSRRFRKLKVATEQQIKSSGGAVAGLARDAISFERTTARGGGLIIEIVPRQSMLADTQRHGDVVVRQGQAQGNLGRRYPVAYWRY